MRALDAIHADLSSLKRQRRTALATYAGLLAVFVGVYLLQPAGPNALERDLTWTISFVLLLAGALSGAMITIGYPLVKRGTTYAVAALMLAGCVGALLLTIEASAMVPTSQFAAGMPCFMYGTAVSALAMLVLGIISGQVWRRFPAPGFPLAMGMTGIGIAALHAHCGGRDALHLLGFHFTPLLVVYGLAHLLVRTRNKLYREM